MEKYKTYLVCLGCIIFTFLCEHKTFAKNENIVSLVVTGQGKTFEQGIQVALREAIQQSFGVFISSNTEILEDDLVKDEIISISNGNIKSYEVISQNFLNNEFFVTVKATVSIDKLSSFIINKGGKSDFNGDLYAYNIKEIKLNSLNESLLLKNLLKIIRDLANISFDYKIETKNPVKKEKMIYENGKNIYKEIWSVSIDVLIQKNNNFSLISNYISKTLGAISLKIPEIENYNKFGLEYFSLAIFSDDFSVNSKNFKIKNIPTNGEITYTLLRNKESIEILKSIFRDITLSPCTFYINDGIRSYEQKLELGSFIRFDNFGLFDFRPDFDSYRRNNRIGILTSKELKYYSYPGRYEVPDYLNVVRNVPMNYYDLFDVFYYIFYLKNYSNVLVYLPYNREFLSSPGYNGTEASPAFAAFLSLSQNINLSGGNMRDPNLFGVKTIEIEYSLDDLSKIKKFEIQGKNDVW
jgi:hypothetical protein